MINAHRRDREDRITRGERAALRLVSKLDMSNVPLHLYGAIISWVTNEINTPESVNEEMGIAFFTDSIPSRISLTEKMICCYGLKHLQPVEKVCYLPGYKRIVYITCHE